MKNPTIAVQTSSGVVNPLSGLPTLRDAGIGNCRYRTAVYGSFQIYCGRECKGVYCKQHSKNKK